MEHYVLQYRDPSNSVERVISGDAATILPDILEAFRKFLNASGWENLDDVSATFKDGPTWSSGDASI